MRLSEIRAAYEEQSGLLSKFNRQLAFAGISIVWLFRITDTSGSTTIDSGMLTPILCFILSFAFDLLQYLWLSLFWYLYYWYKHESGSKEDEEVHEPEWPNIIGWVMFVVKVAALMAAYIHLGIYLYSTYLL